MSALLVEAIQYYEKNRFKMLDVPFLVDYDVSAVTKPSLVNDLIHDEHKVYVGSGEQSFIQLMKDGVLPKGRFMCITPCFRNETVLDDTHHLMFLKLELISFYEKASLNDLHEIVSCAYRFFQNYSENLRVLRTEDSQYDIFSNGIEIGSYGIRNCKYGEYVYGTGLALPRSIHALTKKKP